MHKINTHDTDIHALSGIRTHDLSVRAGEDSSYSASTNYEALHALLFSSLLISPNILLSILNTVTQSSLNVTDQVSNPSKATRKYVKSESFKSKGYTKKQGLLASCFKLASCWAYSSILKMWAIWSSETSVEFQRTTRRHIPEDRTLQYTEIFSCAQPSHGWFAKPTFRRPDLSPSSGSVQVYIYPDDGGRVNVRNARFLIQSWRNWSPEKQSLGIQIKFANTLNCKWKWRADCELRTFSLSTSIGVLLSWSVSPLLILKEPLLGVKAEKQSAKWRRHGNAFVQEAREKAPWLL
jgi:hypothetical protein